jgi:hypothetical protein
MTSIRLMVILAASARSEPRSSLGRACSIHKSRCSLRGNSGRARLRPRKSARWRQLYQVGRGVDVAWAWAEIIDAPGVERRLAEHVGTVHRPIDGEGETFLCPQRGSLESLEERFDKTSKRFIRPGREKGPAVLLAGAPKSRFRSVAYDSPPQRFLFDLRQLTERLSSRLAARVSGAPCGTPPGRRRRTFEACTDAGRHRAHRARRDHRGATKRTKRRAYG